MFSSDQTVGSHIRSPACRSINTPSRPYFDSPGLKQRKAFSQSGAYRRGGEFRPFVSSREARRMESKSFRYPIRPEQNLFFRLMLAFAVLRG